MSQTPPVQRYVIVVHGMGEARKNETVIAVASRFAEARRGKLEAEASDVVTLGMATGQTGKEVRVPDGLYTRAAREFRPWLEFEGIPAAGQAAADAGPFLGEPCKSGANLRFADCAWADLCNEEFAAVGQAPELWTDGVLGRLERKDARARRDGKDAERPPEWALAVLRLVRDTSLLVHRILAVRAKWLDETIFAKYLGDVQLYGEYSHLRGRAVRRFHRLLWRIEEAHAREQARRRAEDAGYQPKEARYTVVAHSLGTVMAMDALLYAHASLEARLEGEASGRAVESFPFAAYLDREVDAVFSDWRRYERMRRKALPNPRKLGELADRVGWLETSWVDRVDSFVTMGSPIDKFLVIWWLNYRYLLREDWIDPGRAVLDGRRITHLNYCDEQDPVGHHLDVAQSAPAFARVFETQEDSVYVRHPIPGAAHVTYWRDLRLFKQILRRAVDEQPERATPPGRIGKLDPYDKSIYRRIVEFSYVYPPLLLVVFGSFAFTWAWFTESWHARLLAVALMLAGLALGWRLIDLNVWWRQILRKKAEERGGSLNLGKYRGSEERWFRWGVWALPKFLWVAALLYWRWYFQVAWPGQVFKGRALVIVAASLALWLVWGKYRSRILGGATSEPDEPTRGAICTPQELRGLHLRITLWTLAALTAAFWLNLSAGPVISGPRFLSFLDFVWLFDLEWVYDLLTRKRPLQWLGQRLAQYAPGVLLTTAVGSTFGFAAFEFLRKRFVWVKRQLEDEKEADYGTYLWMRSRRLASAGTDRVSRAIQRPLSKLPQAWQPKMVRKRSRRSLPASRRFDFRSYAGP